MSRAPRVLAAAIAVATMAGCAPAPEEALLRQFFAASRLRDLTALAGLATTIFEPGTDGIVTTFSITSVVTKSEGQRVSREVSIIAPVKLPGGQLVQKNYIVTMQPANPHAGDPIGRWIVTSVRETERAASPRRS